MFNELLTNAGNEIHLKTAEEIRCVGTRSVLELRRRLIPQRYVMIGYMDAETFRCSFALSLNDSVTLKPDDKRIVIGESGRMGQRKIPSDAHSDSGTFQ